MIFLILVDPLLLRASLIGGLISIPNSRRCSFLGSVNGNKNWNLLSDYLEMITHSLSSKESFRQIIT